MIEDQEYRILSIELKLLFLMDNFYNRFKIVN